MRRPLCNRIWLWKPEWHWHGWKTLIPFFTGSDEYDWHTICIGWTITGRVVIATRPCPGTGKCADIDDLKTWSPSDRDYWLDIEDSELDDDDPLDGLRELQYRSEVWNS